MDALNYVLVWLVMTLFFSGWQSASAEPTLTPEAKKAAEKCRPPLTAEEAEKFEQFFDKVKRAKLADLTERMKKEVGEIQAATGIDDAHAQTLQAALQQAVDEYAVSWMAHFEIDFIGRRFYAAVNWTPTLDRSIRQVSLYARTRTSKRPEPRAEAAWQQALEHTLTTDQRAAWSAVLDEKSRAREKENASFLANATSQIGEESKASLAARSGLFIQELGLSREQAKALEDLCASVAGKVAQAFGGHYRTLLGSLDDDLLGKYRTGFYTPLLDPDERALEKAAWNEGLEKILGPEDLRRWKANEEARKTRLAGAIARLMMVELDERVAMSSGQRERILPLLEKLAFPVAESEPMDDPRNMTVCQPMTLLTAAGALRREDLAPILDEAQCRRWEEVCSLKYLSAFARTPYVSPSPAAGAVEVVRDPENVEEGISDFMHEKIALSSGRITSEMVLKAEDAGRIAGLTSPGEDRLKVAAKGAAEEAKELWESNLANSVRAQLREATPQNLPQRLAAISSYYFVDVRQVKPETQPLWTSALSRELTEPQMAAWKKELQAREAWRDASVAFWLTTAFDQFYHVTAEQREKLLAKIPKVIANYGPEFASYSAPVTGSRWYLQYYFMLMPFAGLPEEDLKAILPREAWDRYSQSEQTSELGAYWTNVKQAHEARLKGAN